MAARKLQTEIDRTLKKVSEGVEQFEAIYDKMQASTNQTQKEKLETDLKTQIKRLQRLRDQIKAWITSNDIKDKSALVENRRLIETQMEKFKACEKEMKTKAFSKEGLIQAAKLDPKEQEREEAITWVAHSVEELQMQVEATEAEIESLGSGGRKRNKGASGDASRKEELEGLNVRRKWHITRLEIILRMLTNGSLSIDNVNALKEDVQYFVESNTDENFYDNEALYDDLNLDEALLGPAGDDEDGSEMSDDISEDTPPRPTKKHDEESVSSGKRDDSPILKKASVSLNLRKQSVDTKPPPNPNFVQQPMASILKQGLQTHPTPAPRPAVATILPPIRYAAAAAAAVTASSTSSSLAPSATPTTPSVASASHTQPPPLTAPSIPHSTTATHTPGLEHQATATSSPSLTQMSGASPMMSSSASVSQQPDGSFYSGQESPVVSEAGPTNAIPQSPQQEIKPRNVEAANSPIVSQSPNVPHPPPETGSAPQHANGSHLLQSQQVPPAAISSPLPQQLQQPTIKAPSASTTPAAQQPLFSLGVKVPLPEQSISSIGTQRPSSAAQQVPQHRPNVPTAFPGSLSDLVVSFENVKQKALRAHNFDHVHKMLEGGYTSVPQPQDTEKPKYYVPRNPFQTAPYYPQAPHPLLTTPAIFSQLDVETLFWVFYYLPGTYQQYLAAKELKRQSWRFHVKYLTWFQRHSEPQAITDEYEQGVYVYFDWEGSWCQRKKSDFRFEYRYLSED